MRHKHKADLGVLRLSIDASELEEAIHMISDTVIDLSSNQGILVLEMDKLRKRIDVLEKQLAKVIK